LSDRAVTNSTCLIGLERIGRLDLLPQVFSSITIPLAVQLEVGISADWLTLRTVGNSAVVASLRTQIDEGESEAIALAMELGDVFLILDDRKARQIAEQIGLKVIGTVGMLLRAKHKGVISEIKPLLRALEEADFRISEAIVQKALQLAGEL
jgi:predicted nucleic acid-binding protein